jgi:hypothetical protein
MEKKVSYSSIIITIYMKMMSCGPVGGVNVNTNINRSGIIPPTIQGFLLPYLDFVRSDKAPMTGSLMAFQTAQIINAKTIKIIFNPTTKK